MNINRFTYESVFIDFLDGQLSDEDIRVLISFLDQNPDLEEELKDLINFRKSQTSSVATTQGFNSDCLKRQPILTEEDSNFEELCIAFYEGLLNEKEEFHLIELTENNEALKETFKAYSQTTAKADLSIVYPNKKSLKKHKKIVLNRYVSYAASIIFILAFIFIIRDKNKIEQLNNPVQYSSNYNSYIDYPKVDVLKKQAYSQLTNEIEEKTTPANAKQIAPASVPAGKSVNKTKNIAVNYDLEQLEEFNENSPLSYSRKGKLSYSNLTELELHLQKVFKEKNINRSSVEDESPESKEININKTKQTVQTKNKTVQLAISFNPLEFQKQILGSQPIK